jgi:flagellar basal-body rod protein FlgG
VSGALEIAAVGMRAQQTALETTAGNISNINTPAYKRVDIRFAELVGAGASDRATGPTGGTLASVAGVSPWSLNSFDSQGQVEATGNPLDLAVQGSGFVEVLGPGGKTLLWRGGTIRVMEDGALATSSGLIFKAGINIPADAAALRIDGAGKVWAVLSDNPSEVQIGEIGMVRVVDPTAVERLDGGFYALNDEAGVLAGAPGTDGLGTFVQGSIERSNVDLNAEMVSMLISQRAYAANAQVARAADEFLGIANGLRR